MFNIKNLTKRIKNKKLKGNISLLVILVLLATSVITLLSINQITRLITYGNQTFSYFRAYYLAKAGTELGLAEVYNRGDGFNNKIPKENSIVTGNLLSGYSAFNPYFDTTITGSFQNITNDVRISNECIDENKITLQTGAGIMLSLFYDKTTGTKNILSGGTNNHNIFSVPENNILELDLNSTPSSSSELTFAFFTYSYDNELKDYFMNDIIVKTGTNLNNFLKNDDVKELINKLDLNLKKYLTIKNSGTNPVEFCITMGNNPIPYSNSLITTIGHYGDTEVGIQSIVKKGIPGWTINVIGEPNS